MTESFNASLAEGMKAPNFTLSNESGERVSLSDFLGKRIVLYFYPKDMTSGCTIEAQEFRDHKYEFSDLNAVVLGVSRDSVKSHKEFCEKENLDFNLLSDFEGKVSSMYNVLKKKSVFGVSTISIERTTFLIDENGIVKKIYRKVKSVDHAEKVIADIKKL